MKSNAVTVFLGKRGSGKSNMMLDILMHKRADYHCGMVISPTDAIATTPTFRGRIPPNLCLKSFEPDKVNELMDYQERLKLSGSSLKSMIALDDMNASASVWRRDPIIKKIFFNGRHYNIGAYITCQATLALTPDQRANIDYVFIFRTQFRSERKKLYDYYAGMFPTFDVFEKTLAKVTENYGALVLDMTSQSNKLSDMIFFYKASLEHPGRLMEPQWNKWNKRQLDTNKNKVKEATYTTSRGRVTIRQIQKRRGS